MSRQFTSVVLGGSGFLGQALCARLVSAGHVVRSVSRSGRPGGEPASWRSSVDWIAAPIDSADAIHALDGADIVYHLASSTLPSTSNLDMPFDLESNALATVRLLDAAKGRIGKLVFVSSGGTVYGVPRENPISESHPTNPICSYGIHKLAIEKYLHLFERLHGLRSIILRVSNIYGEDQNCAKPLGAIAHFTSHAIQGEPIEIWGDGSIIRDYVHVDDVVRALLTSATYSGQHSLFNIGSGVGTSLNELVDQIRKHAPLPVRVNYRQHRNFDVDENVLDIGLASKEMPWQPEISVQTGMQRIFERRLAPR